MPQPEAKIGVIGGVQGEGFGGLVAQASRLCLQAGTPAVPILGGSFSGGLQRKRNDKNEKE